MDERHYPEGPETTQSCCNFNAQLNGEIGR